MSEQKFDAIVAGQRAVLEAIREAISGQNAYFVIGAISALNGQADALKNHILESLPDPEESILSMAISDMMYKYSVKTEIMSYKVETEDEDDD